MLTRVGVPVEYEAEPSAPDPEPTTFICFSHLRWNFVFQRPQHLMSRFAREMNVIYWEEPVEIGPKETAYLQVREARGRVQCPRRRSASAAGHAGGCARSGAEAPARRACRVDPRPADRLVLHADDAALLARISTPTSPCSTRWTSCRSSSSRRVKLLELEQELIDRADMVFTGGSSLYEAKKDRHANVHCFPSSVDRAHFSKARARLFDPADQEDLPQAAARLLRRDRRAVRHRAARQASPRCGPTGRS